MLRRPVAAAHLQQRAHHDADHVLQKAGAMEGEYHPVLPALDSDVVHQTDGGLLHARIAAEAGEVVFTQQIRCRLPHFLHIRVVVQQGDVLPVKHRLHRPGVAGVAVGLAQGVIAGVETGRGLLHLADGNGVGEIAVQIVTEGVGRLRHVQHHIGGHGPGVDTGVGAARADDVHRMALQCAQHGLQLPLDGILVRLALPAEEAGAVVGDGEPVVLFHKKITPFLPYCNRKDVICEVFYSQPIIWTKLYSSFRP